MSGRDDFTSTVDGAAAFERDHAAEPDPPDYDDYGDYGDPDEGED